MQVFNALQSMPSHNSQVPMPWIVSVILGFAVAFVARCAFASVKFFAHVVAEASEEVRSVLLRGVDDRSERV